VTRSETTATGVVRLDRNHYWIGLTRNPTRSSRPIYSYARPPPPSPYEFFDCVTVNRIHNNFRIHSRYFYFYKKHLKYRAHRYRSSYPKIRLKHEYADLLQFDEKKIIVIIIFKLPHAPPVYRRQVARSHETRTTYTFLTHNNVARNQICFYINTVRRYGYWGGAKKLPRNRKTYQCPLADTNYICIQSRTQPRPTPTY